MGASNAFCQQSSLTRSDSSLGSESAARRLSEEAESDPRSYYGYATIGVIEPLGLGVGYQIDNNWAVGIKLGQYWLSGGTYIPNGGGGVGLRVSERIKLWVANNVNYEITSLLAHSKLTGVAVDVNLGRESIEKGVNFIWSLGITGTSAEGSSLLILPNLKIGLVVNF